jgi:hypothetical protein
LAAVLESHGDTARAGKLNDFLNAGILAAFGDDDTVKGTAGFEGFANRVNAGETVHGELQFSVASLQFTVQRRQFTAAVQRWMAGMMEKSRFLGEVRASG